MISPELEMRPIARRSLTADELELKRYAAAELKGSLWCVFSIGDRKRQKRPERKKDAENHEPERALTDAVAQPQRS